MTKLVVNVPDTAEGTPVEVVGFGLFKNGETVDLGYDVLDANGRVVPTVRAYEPPPPPVKEEDTGADDTPEDNGEEG